MSAEPRRRHYLVYSDPIEGSLDHEVNSFLEGIVSPRKKQEWIRRACAFMYAIDSGRVPMVGATNELPSTAPATSADNAAKPKATVIEEPALVENQNDNNTEGALNHLKGSLQV